MPTGTFFGLSKQSFSSDNMRHLFPAIAFIGGFLWDALTIGQRIQMLDMVILLGYLLAAGLILWWLGHRHQQGMIGADIDLGRFEPLPFLALQFLFGGLFSALFIMYFKSAGHLLALLSACLIGVLLILNEFIHRHYKQFTLTWSLFGLAAMLLFNFLLPFAIGSIHTAWFFIGTLAGASLAHVLRKHTPGCPGDAWPIWAIAALLVTGYLADAIPPVPLVKREMQVGVGFSNSQHQYQLMVEKGHWWQWEYYWSNPLHIQQGQAVYCVTSVFAPPSLHTKLYHHWQHLDAKQGWLTTSRIGFSLAGGRKEGFRGYTYIQNLQAGEWKVSVETETGHTLATEKFEVILSKPDEQAEALNMESESF